MSGDIDAYERQGFGADLQPEPPYGVLIVDLVNDSCWNWRQAK